MGKTLDEDGLTFAATGEAAREPIRVPATDDGRAGSAGVVSKQTLIRRCAAELAVRARSRLGARFGGRVGAAVSVLERAWARACALRRAGEGRESSCVPTVEEAVENARKEWLRAVSYFDQVVEPELIDYATYSLRAAERKYVYLLRKAREESASAAHSPTS